MSNEGFTFKIRTQFSFIVDDCTLSSILSGIAKQEINITGYLQTKLFEIDKKSSNNLNSNFNVVRLVVGSPDSEKCSDLLGVRDILASLGTNFQEKKVIQVLEIASGVPGVINGIFAALLCEVIVYAIYYGEQTRLFIDTSDICKSLLILSHPLDEQL